MAVILAFGDSITFGSWVPVNSSWCSLLRSHMDSKFDGNYSSYGRVYNLGIGGETSEDAIKRFLPETQARLRDEEEIIFIIAFGTNDACFLFSKQKFRVTPERFSENMQQLVNAAKHISSKIILLNIIPVIDALTVKPADKDRSLINKNIEPYNQQLVKVAQKNSLTLVDVNTAFQRTDYTKLLGKDGLHPNESGHQLIFELISPEVDKLLTI